MSERLWNVYLAGEIHTDWRQQIHNLAETRGIPVRLMSPQLDHSTSDNCGDAIFGDESNTFWKDHRAAKINTIRNRSILDNSDIVIVRFGEKYRQWNAAFDAGRAIALGKSLVTLHDPSLNHALKEIDAVALAVTETPDIWRMVVLGLLAGAFADRLFVAARQRVDDLTAENAEKAGAPKVSG